MAPRPNPKVILEYRLVFFSSNVKFLYLAHVIVMSLHGRDVGYVGIVIHDNLTALSVGFVILGKSEYLNQES